MKFISVLIPAAVFMLLAITDAAQKTISHNTWGLLLAKYVSSGMVDYAGLMADSSDRMKLDEYLKALADADIKAFSREQKLAFWINAYNAFTVKLILENYPVESIKKIKNPWKRDKWRAAGETLSLDDIEHKKLRAELKEPRIHFAIVCASKGCPDMDDKAFKAQNLEKHLEERTLFFFSQDKNCVLEDEKSGIVLCLSKIFQWFAEDFGANKAQRLVFISRYLDKAKAVKLSDPERVKIKYIQYDWSLNGR